LLREVADRDRDCHHFDYTRVHVARFG
jgi:hypothetical protein